MLGGGYVCGGGGSGVCGCVVWVGGMGGWGATGLSRPALGRRGVSRLQPTRVNLHGRDGQPPPLVADQMQRHLGGGRRGGAKDGQFAQVQQTCNAGRVGGQPAGQEGTERSGQGWGWKGRKGPNAAPRVIGGADNARDAGPAGLRWFWQQAATARLRISCIYTVQVLLSPGGSPPEADGVQVERGRSFARRAPTSRCLRRRPHSPGQPRRRRCAACVPGQRAGRAPRGQTRPQRSDGPAPAP